MEITFEAPAKPWSTNEDRNLHYMERRGLIDAWKDATIYAYISHMNKAGLGRRLHPMFVTVTIPFPRNRRRDPHNYCGTVVKAVIDGLVLAGAWEDDTPEYVRHIEPVLMVDKAMTVKIELEEMK